jgi:PD-(D/E)XK endonuclease
MQHPKDIGDRSTLAIIFALHMQGYTVLLPFGENSRYDLVVDTGSLRRVQCKTGRLRNGKVIFPYLEHLRSPRESEGPNPDLRGRDRRVRRLLPGARTHLLDPDRGRHDGPPRHAQSRAVSKRTAKGSPPGRRLRDRPDRCLLTYCRTWRDSWWVRIFRFTRCSALSIVFVSHPRSSAISSYDEPSR